MTKKFSYQNKLHHLIPGGAHTYSRGDDAFPSNAPAILSHAKGCYTWDPDGKKYLDYQMACRSVTVGYDYEPISDAAIKAIRQGNNLSRASVIELEAAETLCNLIPSAEMVKFAKNGSTVTTAAIKLARAYTEKKYVAVCSDHPFFSYDDWFIGTTPMDAGIPDAHKSLILQFRYNDIESLKCLFNKFPKDIAAVILEPAQNQAPKNNFLEQLRALCTKEKTVLIFDEMITGFRWHLQGAQTYFGVEPDLTTFGKGMANGFSVAALCGKKEIMELGGIKNKGSKRVFLISTTHGAELSSLAAFIKTMEIYKSHNVIDHFWNYGQKLMDGMNNIAKSKNISANFKVTGIPCSPHYICCDQNGNQNLDLRTIFCQEMCRHNILMTCIALSFAHQDQAYEQTLTALDKALTVYKKALENNIQDFIEGEPLKPIFRPIN